MSNSNLKLHRLQIKIIGFSLKAAVPLVITVSMNGTTLHPAAQIHLGVTPESCLFLLPYAIYFQALAAFPHRFLPFAPFQCSWQSTSIPHLFRSLFTFSSSPLQFNWRLIDYWSWHNRTSNPSTLRLNLIPLIPLKKSWPSPSGLFFPSLTHKDIAMFIFILTHIFYEPWSTSGISHNGLDDTHTKLPNFHSIST